MAPTSSSPAPDQAAAPLVSVILPGYNRARTLPKAMQSVLVQNYANLELIVVDDASSDDTAAVVAACPDPRVRYLRHERNQGAAAARNTGLAVARGEIIAFQDSDDEWLLDKLETQVAALLDAGDDYGACFGGKILHGRDAGGRFGDRRACYVPDAAPESLSGDIRPVLLRRNVISPQTMIMRRAVLERVGGFDTRLPCNNDWEFMLRLSGCTKVLYTGRPAVVAFISDDSISKKTKNKALSLMVIMKKLPEVFAGEPQVYAECFFRIARHLQALGKPRSAARFAARAAQLNPRAPKAWLLLALLWGLRLRPRSESRSGLPAGGPLGSRAGAPAR